MKKKIIIKKLENLIVDFKIKESKSDSIVYKNEEDQYNSGISYAYVNVIDKLESLMKLIEKK